jgi:hypothetical protein
MVNSFPNDFFRISFVEYLLFLSSLLLVRIYTLHYDVSFRTADTLVRTIARTGVPALDRLLGGGYEYGIIHLFYGQ